MATPVRDGNLIYLFGHQPEQEREPTESLALEEVSPDTSEMTVHPLDTYLSFLHDREFITTKEMVVMVAALEPLRAHFHGLSTIDMVRDELRAKGATVDAMRRAERELWDLPQLPWFDLEASLHHFLVEPSKAEDHLVFLNEAARTAMKPYVDPQLRNAEVFFWVILRMYRLHATNIPADSVDPEGDNSMTEPTGNRPTGTITRLLDCLLGREKKPS